MRKLVVFLIMLSTAFASCDDYVYSAVHDFGTACVYPGCFGSASRYKEAAFCYLGDGDKATADIYFQKAAEYYIQGITYIGPAGDYPLRAPSYEYAGDMEAQLGNRVLATNYYNSAIAEYQKLDSTAKLDSLYAKKTALETPAPQQDAQTGFAVTTQNLAIGAVLVVIAVALFFYFKRGNRVEEAPVEVERPKQHFDDLVRVEREPQRQPEPDAKHNAKEKMRDKIRKKYGLE